jgi:hypothetical protein
MANAVERHLTLIRMALEAHNGVLFQVVGDAVQAAFLTAPRDHLGCQVRRRAGSASVVSRRDAFLSRGRTGCGARAQKVSSE